MLYLKAPRGNLSPGDASKPALTARFVPFRLHCLNSMCIPEFPLSSSGPTEKIHLTAAGRSFQSSPHVRFCTTSREGYEVHTRRLFQFARPGAARSTASLKSGTRVGTLKKVPNWLCLWDTCYVNGKA